MQYYTDSHTGGHSDSKDSGVETRKFFINCLCLLLGRLDSKKFESTIVEYGMQISRELLPQVCLRPRRNKLWLFCMIDIYGFRVLAI